MKRFAAATIVRAVRATGADTTVYFTVFTTLAQHAITWSDVSDTHEILAYSVVPYESLKAQENQRAAALRRRRGAVALL